MINGIDIMEKCNLILWAVALVAFVGKGTANAQTAEVALASIDYELIHVNDTNNRDEPVKRNMRVYLGQESSHYVDQSAAEAFEKIEERMREMNLQRSGSVSSISIRRPSSRSGMEDLYLYPTDKKLIMIDQISTTEYLIEQDFPELEWIIGDETKEIAGYSVQQASADFGGRHYTVWFAPDLPFSFGPWKLHGLPGLILEAADKSGDVQFVFKDFGRLEGVGRQIVLPEKGVKASPAQFARAKTAFDNNPAAGRQSNAPAGSGTVTSQQIVIIDNGGGNRRTLTGDEAREELDRRKLQNADANNNPLEINVSKK